jgi:hypothetical protein
MGDSVKLQIANAVETALNQASVTLNAGTPNEATYSKPSDLTVHRLRLTPVEHDDLPAQVIYILDSPKPDERAADTIDRVTRIGVESRKVIELSGAPPDDQMDELEMWVVRAIMADPTLGGVAHLAEEAGDDRDFPKKGERFFGQSALVFDIHYQTLRNDPELKT